MPENPDQKAYEAAKERLIKRLNKMILNSQELQDDIEWWNQNRTEHPPFDPGGDIVFEKMCRDMLALVNADKPIPAEMMRKMNEQAEASATRDE